MNRPTEPIIVKTNGSGSNGSGKLLNNILLGLLTAAISIIGIVTIEFKRDLLSKVDRIVLTFQEEKRAIMQQLNNVCETIGDTKIQLKNHETLLRLDYKAREKIMMNHNQTGHK